MASMPSHLPYIFLFLGFPWSLGGDRAGLKAHTKGGGATVAFFGSGFMGVPPHLLRKRTKFYSFIFTSVRLC